MISWPRFDDVSPNLLVSLIRVDLTARWGRTDRQRPEDYLRRYASIAADPDLAVDVIYAEYLVREQSGEQPEAAEYQTRFPHFARVLSEQIRLHHAIDTLDSDDTPVDTARRRRADPAPAESMGNEAGFEILERIGSGGMGVVYKARQASLNRFVALKMVAPSTPAIASCSRGFAPKCASLPRSIIPTSCRFTIAASTTACRTLRWNWSKGARWPIDWTARCGRRVPPPLLMIKLSDAVHFAHQHQVIHRDLKPANVLVVSDEKELEVKITDFGLAKFLADDSTSHTKTYGFLGTPSYMSPEQASGRSSEVGPAADIYSLGAILYELLTGQPPVRGESPIETLRLLLAQEPYAAHTFDPRIPRDLATICEKCLQHEPHRRYASAADLQEDLHRYLDGRPILARRVGNAECAWRRCRRNPLLAAAIGSAAMLLVGIAVISLWYSAQLGRELAKTRQVEQSERLANHAAQLRLWDSLISEASARNGSRQVGQRFAVLKTIDQATALLTTLGHSDQRQRSSVTRCCRAPCCPICELCASFGPAPADGQDCAMLTAADCCVVTGSDSTVAAYRLSDGKPLWSREDFEPRAIPVLSRDGRCLAVVGQQSTTVWSLEEGFPRLLWEAAGARFFSFSPNGQHAAYGTDNGGMNWVRATNGEIVHKIGSGSALAVHLRY